MSESHYTDDTGRHDWHTYHPALIRMQNNSAHPLGRRIMWTLFVLLLFVFAWAWWGRLDIIAVADGRLIPASRLKIIQPAEAGIIRQILVEEGDSVQAGQTLMRMDSVETDTDLLSLTQQQARAQLTLGRLQAELSESPFAPAQDLPQALARDALALYRADRQALASELAEEQARLTKALQELAAAQQQETALRSLVPYYQRQAESLAKLAKQGLSAKLKAEEKQRERIEKEQELATQEHLIESARASIDLSRKKIENIKSSFVLRQRNELEQTTKQLAQIKLDIRKQQHRQSLLDLKAPQDGVIKQLATHTLGTVVQPGTVLASLIPKDSHLQAEVWLSNKDIGFVHPGQPVKLKLAAYPFQKYGMLDGRLTLISADAQSAQEARTAGIPGPMQEALRYRTLVDIDTPVLQQDGHRYPLFAGMQANAEIRLGTRTVADYLLSPISKAWYEAGRER